MKVLLHLTAGVAILFSATCRSHTRTPEKVAELPTPSPQINVTWSSSDLVERIGDNKDLRRAWESFERSQKYRLAQPSDRKLTPAAMERVKKNNENQIKPFLTWWGASGSVHMECYRRDGTQEIKEIVWRRRFRQFRLE